MTVLRVLVAGDDPLARNGLAAALQADDVEVVDRVDLRERAAAMRAHHPDVLLWDLGIGRPVDREDLRDLASAGVPAVGVVDDEASVPALLGAGLRGVVSRATSGPRLLAALRAAAADLIVLDPALAEAALRSRVPSEPPAEPLTAREGEVLALLAEGLTNRAIAARLGITDHTVKFHVNAILGKLGVESRAEAIVQAIRLGLVVL